MFKRYHILLSILLYSLSYGVEVEPVNTSDESFVNENFKFIQDIYSESWALIIGINRYENVEPLTYAVDDAEAVRLMLMDNYGFKDENITYIIDEDATKENILDGFSDLLEKAGEKDRVVVFYAGHGETYKLPSGGDMGYLIPVDGNLDNLYRSSIPMKSVYDIAEMSYAKHILYLVDACYGGLTLSTRGLKKDSTPEYLRKMTQERGRMVITAGGKDEQVIEKPEWGHSAFTRNLLKGLGEGLADENADGIITADELGGFIRNRVTVDVDGAHTPQKGRIGSEMGEFVFISETLGSQMEEAFPRDVQIENMSSKVKDLERELKKKEQENRMQKVGGEYYNISFALGRQSGFTIVGSIGSSIMSYVKLQPPVPEGYEAVSEFMDMGALFEDVTGIEELPTPERIDVPSFSIEKRLGPIYGGIGFYNTGFKLSQTVLFQSITTSYMFDYLHLYSFYPYVISSRIAVGAGLGIGIPISGEVVCEGVGCAHTPITIETKNIDQEYNILLNTSFAITQRYAIRLHYQHGLTEIGEFLPMVLDDPETPIIQDASGNSTGNEAEVGFKGLSTRSMGISLVLRF